MTNSRRVNNSHMSLIDKNETKVNCEKGGNIT